jgi:hypothetical protein
MKFFQGFTWAVPTSFSDALASCQFEEGDTLYDNRLAYERWGTALKNINYSIQVTYPKRKQKITTTKQNASIFQKGWNSDVEFELTDFKKGGGKKHITTTQGRLYTLLWRGKLNVLERMTPTPNVILLSEAKKQLKQIVSNIDYVPIPSFFIIYDSTNPLLRKKRLMIDEALNKHFSNYSESGEIRLESIELTESKLFLPTLSIVKFTPEGVDVNNMYDALKEVLYKPSKIKKTDSDSFQIKAHGLLIPEILNGANESWK